MQTWRDFFVCVFVLLLHLWNHHESFGCVCSLPTASLLLKKYHGGYVVIRLALGGATNRPFYRIVAAYNKRARDGKYIEQLGSYDPLPNIYNEKLVSFNYDRIKYWMGCGAHPTKPVAKLLGQYLYVGIIFISEMSDFLHLKCCLCSINFRTGWVFPAASDDDNAGRTTESGSFETGSDNWAWRRRRKAGRTVAFTLTAENNTLYSWSL